MLTDILILIASLSIIAGLVMLCKAIQIKYKFDNKDFDIEDEKE